MTETVLLIAPVPPPFGGMALQAGQLGRLLEQDGMRVVRFPSNFELPGGLRVFEKVPGLRTGLRALWIWVKLWRQMPRIQIIHIFAASWLYFFAVACPAIVVGRIHRKRLILNYRGGGAKQFFDKFGFVLRPFFRAVSAVTAPSEFLAEIIQSHFDVPVSIVPNILDFSLFRYRCRSTVQPKLLVTRHLEAMYDIESVIRAFQLVQSRHPEATLWIAGTGSQETYLRDLVENLGLKWVRFLGQVPHKDLPATLDQCDIFINASLVDNFPGSLLEASAAGLPVVSTNSGGIPAIYQDGKNALLRNPSDWRGLAEAVDEVLMSPSLAMKLSTEGAAVARNCDWTAVRKSLYLVYGTAPEPDPVRTVSAR